MKQILFAAVISLSAAPLAAQPMWEQAKKWRCDMKMHLILDLNAQSARPTGQVNSFEIDFEKLTRTSGFVETVGKISDLNYVESVFGGFNMFNVDWAGEAYPNMIIEKGGEFWESSASGHPSREVWMSNYQCVPLETG